MKNKRTPNNPEPVDYELCVMSKSEQIAETEKRVKQFEIDDKLEEKERESEKYN